MHREQHGERLAIDLPRSPQAPRRARCAVGDWCERLGIGGVRGEAVRLLVSEIVTNSVQHSAGPQADGIRLHACSFGELVHVSVADGGHEFAPRPRLSGGLGEGGYGLRLLDYEARAWGIDKASGTRIWFEL